MTFASKVTAHELDFDNQDRDLKIGLVCLSTDLTVENDFYLMRPNNHIGFFVNRVEFINPTTRENLVAMQPKLTDAARLILPDMELDAIVYACTSASAVIGDDVVRTSVAKGKPGVPVITPTTATIEGFNRLGIDKITLVAPYIKQVSEILAQYFCDQGLNIHNMDYLDIEDDRDIGRLSPDSIIKAAKQAANSITQGVFLACTALPVVPIIAQLEDELGVPVITSNQAMLWQALRETGYKEKISGFGKLLQLN